MTYKSKIVGQYIQHFSKEATLSRIQIIRRCVALMKKLFPANKTHQADDDRAPGYLNDSAEQSGPEFYCMCQGRNKLQ